MLIRDYRDEDWDRVWPIVREVVRAGDTFTWDPATGEDEARRTWVAGPPGHTIVAEVDDRILGTAITGPNRSGPGAHVATASFMVAAAARGTGVGRAMVRDVLARARRDGYAGMQFNAVAASNEYAVAMYEQEGFAIVGTVPGAFRHPALGRVGLHVMYVELDQEVGAPG